MFPRLAAILATLVWAHCASACLRTIPDERAVQWSSAIVEAKLVAVGERVELAKFEVAAERRGAPKSTQTYWYRLYTFEVNESLDGTVKKGQKISVARFFGLIESPLTVCSQQITRANIGKSFVLLLRPEADTPLNTGQLLQTRKDPRTPKLHQAKAYVTVFVSAKDDFTADQKSDLKKTIAATRKAESAGTPAKLKQTVDQLMAANDESKVTQSRDALIAMGPKVATPLKLVMEKQDEVGKARLEKVLAELLPPAVPIVMEKPSQTGKNDGGNEE
jgi:hypothetical protein